MGAARRSLLLLLCLGLLGLGAAACGSSGDGETGGDDTATAAAGAEEGAFPVAIEHKFGTTTVTEAPERVVVAGLREQDSLLALGVVPVATTEWLGGHPGEIFPWAEDELGDAPVPVVLDSSDGIQFERIAAERPDLIVAVYSGLTQEDYDKLTAIAPTIAQPRGQIDYGASWRDELIAVGKAVGKPAEAQRLLDEREAEIAAVRRRHPEFAGATGLVGTSYEGLYVFGPEDPRSRLLIDLGFEYPPALEDLGGDEFGASVPDEEVSLLDLDAIVWQAGGANAERIRNHPVYRDLDVHTEGHDIFVPESGRFSEAATFITVLSTPLLLDELTPLLARAVAGERG